MGRDPIMPYSIKAYCKGKTFPKQHRKGNNTIIRVRSFLQTGVGVLNFKAAEFWVYKNELIKL